MKILTAGQMMATDRRSVDQGVPLRSLMEEAGAAVARFCLRLYLETSPGQGRVVVVCGKGHNGGDGLVAARHLAAAGRLVCVLLAGTAEAGLREETREVLEELRMQALAEICTATTAEELLEQLRSLLRSAVLVVDAYVGTGFSPPLRGVGQALRDILLETAVPVVAVDLPSGWDADSTAQAPETSGDPAGPAACRADAVITFAAPKLAHVFGHLTPGKTSGPVAVAMIGTPPGAMPVDGTLRWCGASMRLVQLPRAVNGNKGKFGHVMVVGGSPGKTGAPSMASLAALRAGAGLVTAGVEQSILASVAAITPELMTLPLDASAEGGLSLDLLGPDALGVWLKGISVLAMGPGLGQRGTTPEFVRRLVGLTDLPLVLDADALNALAGRTALLREATEAARKKGRPRTIVLTPHPGEMGRLADLSVKEVEADRLGVARQFATEHGITLVLKGWRTLVAHPDGRIAGNTTGNPGMAKGGSGDILTGIVAAMLAQYKDDVPRAVEAAVFLHGLAGDYATLAQDEHTVLATDTVAHLWRGFQTPVKDADGFTWIAGLAARTAAAARTQALAFETRTAKAMEV